RRIPRQALAQGNSRIRRAIARGRRLHHRHDGSLRAACLRGVFFAAPLAGVLTRILDGNRRELRRLNTPTRVYEDCTTTKPPVNGTGSNFIWFVDFLDGITMRPVGSGLRTLVVTLDPK